MKASLLFLLGLYLLLSQEAAPVCCLQRLGLFYLTLPYVGQNKVTGCASISTFSQQIPIVVRGAEADLQIQAMTCFVLHLQTLDQ